MTSIVVNVKDDCKVDDVVRFLRDIDFLDVIVEERRSGSSLSKQSVNKFIDSAKKIPCQRFKAFSRLAVSINDFVMPDREERNAR
jgi:hypothetical protein